VVDLLSRDREVVGSNSARTSGVEPIMKTLKIGSDCSLARARQLEQRITSLSDMTLRYGGPVTPHEKDSSLLRLID
jgi:hypothetical protein